MFVFLLLVYVRPSIVQPRRNANPLIRLDPISLGRGRVRLELPAFRPIPIESQSRRSDRKPGGPRVREIKDVLIVGAGAVGSAVAGIIDRGLPGSVRLLAGPERAARLKAEGLVLNGERRDFSLATPLAAPRAGQETSDLILVAVKHHQLEQAIADMAGHVGGQSLVLSLMNGIDSEDSLAAAFGRERVPWAMILGIDAVREGNETRYSSAGRIHFGDERNHPDAMSARISRIAAFFDRCGLLYTVPEDMIRSMWFKFMINVGVNQASAVLGAPYGGFQRPGPARELMTAAMLEVVALSASLGTALVPADIELWNETLSTLRPEGKTSMLQDIEAGRKTELEVFGGKVVELGRRLGIPVPVNETLLLVLRGLEDGARLAGSVMRPLSVAPLAPA